MAIRVQTLGATDLRLAAPITKGVNYDTPRSIGGVSARYGHWRAVLVRLPAAFGNNSAYFLMGSNLGATGTNASRMTIDGNAAGRAPNQLRAGALYRAGNINSSTETLFTTTTPLTLSTPTHVIVEGFNRIEVSPGVFEWRGWGAVCPVGGTPSSSVRTTAPDASFISSTTAILMQRIFLAEGTTADRSPAGLMMEHAALVQGAFPWDSVNNRPHHDAIASLAAGAGATTLYDYAGLVAAQNANALPYANCIQGRGQLDYWWPLADLTAGGLSNSGTAGAATLALTDWNSLTNGLADEASISPPHWQGGAPVITAPRVKFYGGRGTRAVVVAGTHSGNVRRRWVVEAGGAVVPGFDWATLTVSSNAWATNDMLPVGGPYRLDIEDVGNPALNANMGDVLVGTIMLAHGQSGTQLVFGDGSAGGSLAANNLSVPVAAGAQGMAVIMTNRTAGAPGAYLRPAMLTGRLVGGQTPAMRTGNVTMLNEWNAENPGHPLMICNMAISGTVQADWAANAVVDGGHPSFTFMGSVSQPGVSDAAGSGVVGFWAWFLNQYVDCHAIMWTPNLSNVQATRASYRAQVDDRFANSAAAPWLVLPPWRMHRNPDTSQTGGSGASVNLREQHVLFAGELGARGFLGPYWPDTIADSSDSLHPAAVTPAGGALPVPDTNHVGVARIGRGLGRALARVFSVAVKTQVPILGAWFTDGARTAIAVEAGRVLRTLNGAAIRTDVFWISTDNGATWANTGFTVALDATGTRAVLTSTGAAWPATNVRVDYARNWPLHPSINADEANTEPLLDGLLYDNQTHRGRINLATPAGNALQGSNRTGAGVAGVAVTARGAAKLMASERWTGARPVTVRMMAADRVTVLRERTFVISAS
jgi:hypothetical protein